MAGQAIQTNVRCCRGKWVLEFKVTNMPSAKEWHYESEAEAKEAENRLNPYKFSASGRSDSNQSTS